MQREVFIAGTRRLDSGESFTIEMAPTGQCLAQFPHLCPSLTGTQFSLIHTACPICVELLSSADIGLMAPAGHTVLHLLHSGLQ